MRAIQFDAKARKQSVSSAARRSFPRSIEIVAWPVQRRFSNHGKFQKSFNDRKKNYVTLFTRQTTNVPIESGSRVLARKIHHTFKKAAIFLANQEEGVQTLLELNWFGKTKCPGAATLL